MRHKKNFNHLGRNKAHREAMLSNMAVSLIMHKRIQTTVAKAKALRTFVEPLITKCKDDTTHSRRIVFSYLNDKVAVTELFRQVATKVADRPGGYTRILKTGTRFGDSADMCYIELVDYNETLLKTTETKTDKKTTRRSRSGKKTTEPTAAIETKTSKKTETKTIEEPIIDESIQEVDNTEISAENDAQVEQELDQNTDSADENK